MEKKGNFIFLIDDDSINNELNTLTLKDIPMCEEVLSFTDYEDALKHLLKNQETPLPTVIFIDYNLPASSGLEISEQLKEISSSIKTVILSAHLNVKQTKEVVESINIDDLIIKPLTPEKVLSSFRKMNLI